MEWMPVFLWWFFSTLFGLAVFPLTFEFFRTLPERGAALARAMGLLLAVYLFWLGSSLQLLPNTSGAVLFSIALVAVWGWVRVWRDEQRRQSLKDFWRERWRTILVGEALFLLVFVGWSVVRAYAIGKIMRFGGEKFMEIAFLNGVLNSPTFPPLDPWLSDFAISYYYFGYIIAGALVKLSGVLSAVGFDLFDALLFALTLQGAYGVVFNLVSLSKSNARAAATAGVLGAIFVAGMGNLEGLLESLYARGWLPQSFARWLNLPDFPFNLPPVGSFMPSGGGWWWWRASRVLTDLDLSGNAINLNPITEFPFFSFLLGDNHPHKMALPFVLLAVLIALHFYRLAREDRLPTWMEQGLAGLILGSLAFLNTWDFPIYLALLLLAWLAGRWSAQGRLTREHGLEVLRFGGLFVLAAVLFYLPFWAGFASQAGGILPQIFPPTRLSQYSVMFGHFLLILLVFAAGVLALVRRDERGVWRLFLRHWLGWMLGISLAYLALLGIAAAVLQINAARGGEWSAFLHPYLASQSLGQTLLLVLSYRLSNPWLFLVLTFLLGMVTTGLMFLRPRAAGEGEAPSMPDSALPFVLILVLLGVALTFSVEFLYLKDGFGVRMNTVFKFYFQGWVLMALASAYALWWLVNRPVFARAVRGLALGVITLSLLGGMVYPVLATISRTNAFQSTPTLDAASEFRMENPEDWEIVQWLNANGKIEGRVPILLEAPGKSYTYEGRISAFTGYPAVLGWAIHEMQWRGNYNEQGKREPDIETIYTTSDGTLALELLHKWRVDYVILTNTERTYIRELCAQPERACNPSQAELKFENILIPVFRTAMGTVYRVPPRLP